MADDRETELGYGHIATLKTDTYGVSGIRFSVMLPEIKATGPGGNAHYASAYMGFFTGHPKDCFTECGIEYSAPKGSATRPSDWSWQLMLNPGKSTTRTTINNKINAGTRNIRSPVQASGQWISLAVEIVDERTASFEYRGGGPAGGAHQRFPFPLVPPLSSDTFERGLNVRICVGFNDRSADDNHLRFSDMTIRADALKIVDKGWLPAPVLTRLNEFRPFPRAVPSFRSNSVSLRYDAAKTPLHAGHSTPGVPPRTFAGFMQPSIAPFLSRKLS